MNQLTEDQIGKIIAHWRRPMNESDVSFVTEVMTFSINHFLDGRATLDVKVVPVSDVLGYEKITATVKIKDAPKTYRNDKGRVVKGFDTITVNFERCAGLFDFDEYQKRQKKKSEIFSSFQTEEAKKIIDSLPWDGEAFQMSGHVNGITRGYRCMNWERNGVRAPFKYSNSWDRLAPYVFDFMDDATAEIRRFMPAFWIDEKKNAA